MTRILGIETSCDETAAAVVEDGRRVLSSIVASQNDVHAKYGGVVPELASRHHVEAIGPVVTEALEQAGTTLDDLDAIAVTHGPGLVGSLLVGVAPARRSRWQLGMPLVARQPPRGPHPRRRSSSTRRDPVPGDRARRLGRAHRARTCARGGRLPPARRGRATTPRARRSTRSRKLLGLGYPGGPVIDRLAARARTRPRVEFPRRPMKDGSRDFSFSGLKTAVRMPRGARRASRAAGAPEARPRARCGTSSRRSSARSWTRSSTRRSAACRREARAHGASSPAASPATAGCARAFDEAAARRTGSRSSCPSPRYTTDNAAMIAAAGFLHLERGERAGLDLNTGSQPETVEAIPSRRVDRPRRGPDARVRGTRAPARHAAGARRGRVRLRGPADPRRHAALRRASTT